MRVAFDRDHVLAVLAAVEEGQPIPTPIAAGHEFLPTSPTRWDNDDLLCVAGVLAYQARRRLLANSIQFHPRGIVEHREFVAGVFGAVKFHADMTLAVVNDSYDRQFEPKIVGWIEAPKEEPIVVSHIDRGVRHDPIDRPPRRRRP